MKMKLAIIGTGTVAKDNYIPFLAKQPDVELGYYNRTIEAAQAMADQFGGTVFASLKEVAEWMPTSALILTAETVRWAVGMELIERGVPRLFFEKPLVAAAGQANVSERDFFDARTLLAAADQRGCVTAIVFNYRFFDHTTRARQIIADRQFGAVVNVTGFVHYACWSHAIDLIRCFAGPVSTITALASPGERRSPELDVSAKDVAAAFVFESGATGTLLGTCDQNWQQPLYELTFNFEYGRMHLRDLDGSLEVFDARQQVKETYSLVKDRARWAQYADSFKKATVAYLDSLRGGTAPPIPAVEGLYELQFEAALKRSIDEQRTVRVQEEFSVAN